MFGEVGSSNCTPIERQKKYRKRKIEGREEGNEIKAGEARQTLTYTRSRKQRETGLNKNATLMVKL